MVRVLLDAAKELRFGATVAGLKDHISQLSFVAARLRIRTSPMARLKDLNAEQAREIEHLKERLATAEQRDGSLFDLKRDNAHDIARTIAENIGEGRWKNIKKAVDEHYKTKLRPAG